jgi:hypothetical protein
VSPREIEISNIWYEWLVTSVYELKGHSLIQWGSNHTDEHTLMHTNFRKELEQLNNSKNWDQMWAHAERRYKEIPLIEALS